MQSFTKILPADQPRLDENFYSISNDPDLYIFFATGSLTRDLSAVAKLLVQIIKFQLL